MANFPIFDACTLFGAWPQHAADLSVESLLTMMQQNGIARSLVTSAAGIWGDYTVGNAATFELARAHPQQLFPVATLDPRAFPGCLDEAEKRAGEGFRLFRFFPERQNWPLRFAPFQDVLKRCDELKVPVAVGVSQMGDISILGELCNERNTPLIVSNVTGELLGEAIAVGRKCPALHFETARLTAPRALETLSQALPEGAQRLVFASYSPLRYLSAALGPVMTSPLSDEDKALILGGNLRRILAK